MDHQRALLLLLALAAATLCNGLAADGPLKWRLPLGVGANENTGTMSLAGDDSMLYTADTRGTIFAIEARTGRMRWSIPGSNALDQLFVFPTIPELLYYTAWDLAVVNELTLHAVRKEDGVEVARLRNLSTGNIWKATYAKVIPTDYGLAILHNFGLYSTDPYLNVQWKVDNPLGSNFTGQYFTHLAASGTLIATVARDEVEPEGRAMSFDAQTGRVVCDVSGVTSTLLEVGYWGVPWVITADGWSLMDRADGGVHTAVLVPRAVDLQRCAVLKTERISDWALTWGVTIIPPTNYSDPSQQTLFFGISRPVNATAQPVLWGNFTVTHSKIGSNDTIWNLTLPASAVDSNVVPLFLTKASGIPDAVLLWYLGSFSALDVATGAVRWSLAPTTVPTSPPFSLMDPQTVFPLGDGGRLFIPNLLGYTIVDTYSGDVLEVNFDEPIVAALQYRDSNGNGYVAYINVYGAVVGVH